MKTIDPRLRVLFLLAVAGGAFVLKKPWFLAVLAGCLMALALALGLPARRLVRQVTKLWGFSLIVILSFAFFGDESGVTEWSRLEIGPLSVPYSLQGIVLGVAMVLRVLSIVLASQIVRIGDERSIATGLRKLGAPLILSASVDTILALLGGGGGGGRNRERDPNQPGFFAALGRLARGDVAVITRRVERQIDRAEDHVAENLDPAHRSTARDVAVIAGVSLAMLGIKAVKILPAIPFAPGHKLVLLTPLYVAASLLTRSRAGATWTGLAMGTVAFLSGDGKYGVFEILKHVMPGVLCDLLVPLLTADGRRPSRWVWSAVSGLIAIGRYGAIFLVTLVAQPPSIAFAFLLPGLAIHLTFGLCSGLIIPPVVRAFDETAVKGRRKVAPTDPPSTSAPDPQELLPRNSSP